MDRIRGGRLKAALQFMRAALHRTGPRGSMARAWSGAELLRAAVSDVYGRKPSKREAVPASMTEASPKAAVIP